MTLLPFLVLVLAANLAAAQTTNLPNLFIWIYSLQLAILPIAIFAANDLRRGTCNWQHQQRAQRVGWWSAFTTI